MSAGAAGSEITAPKEGADGGDGSGAQRSQDASVALFAAGNQIAPSAADDLPQGRSARAARVVERGHNSVGEQLSRPERAARGTFEAAPTFDALAKPVATED